MGEYSLRSFVRLLPWIPYRLLFLYTSFMAKVTFAMLWKYRTRMEENVAMALGDQITDPAERRALVRRAWRNFAQGILETGSVMHFSKERIIATVRLKGEEHLKRALAKGKGVLALSAHLGTFTLIGGRLAASGYPFTAVVKHPSDERFARLIDHYRARLGIQTISAKPRREAVRGILRALRKNRIVLVIADEFKSGGVMVDFMGQSSPAPRGPASLALRTGAVTLPMFATRQPDGSLVLSIGPEIEPVQNDDLEQSVTATTALYTRYLEDAIRRYPDQWNWLGFKRNGRIPRSEIGRPKSSTDENSATTRRAAG
ncbi:MAG TPA: lysophospholipid acyltransferase family protein [Methylomirabilota bacterium]|nr:lysophospholipid acyltransferase family protein [Methylomirabilota bacterium]